MCKFSLREMWCCLNDVPSLYIWHNEKYLVLIQTFCWFMMYDVLSYSTCWWLLFLYPVLLRLVDWDLDAVLWPRRDAIFLTACPHFKKITATVFWLSGGGEEGHKQKFIVVCKILRWTHVEKTWVQEVNVTKRLIWLQLSWIQIVNIMSHLLNTSHI